MIGRLIEKIEVRLGQAQQQHAETRLLSAGKLADRTAPGLTGTITPKALSVTGLTAADKVYDKTAVAVVSGTATLLAAEAGGLAPGMMANLTRAMR